jgi:hypothetical protein
VDVGHLLLLRLAPPGAGPASYDAARRGHPPHQFILLNEATGDTKLVQLKGRWTIDKKYIGRNIWVAFPDRGVWYVAPHDEMLRLGQRHTGTESWIKGTYSKSPLSKSDREELAAYRFGDPDAVMEDAAKLGIGD